MLIFVSIGEINPAHDNNNNMKKWQSRIEILPWKKGNLLKLQKRLSFPTSPFTILEAHDQEIDEFYVIQEGYATDFAAPIL